MKISPRRRRLISATAVIAAAGLLAPMAQADEDGTEAPSKYGWAPVGPTNGPLPDELIEELRDCPHPDDIDENLLFCIRIKAYDGQLKVGGTEASVDDPIELTVAVTGQGDEHNIVVVEPEGGGRGGPAAIKMAGGLLGIPALDALIEAIPLNLLTLSATPEIGDATVEGDPMSFLSWMNGSNDQVPVLSIPLSIKLNNLLLGDTCEIGPFELDLTTGTTTPTSGEPMAGDNGTHWATQWWENGFPPTGPDIGRRFLMHTREGSRYVDNAFEVPGASDCGVAGTGKVLRSLGLSGFNVFNQAVSSQAGLPAASGQNYASFKIDTHLIAYFHEESLGGTEGWFWEMSGSS